MIYIGWAFAKGRDVPRDLARAEHWYRRAAETETPLAGLMLGNLYASQRRYPEALRAFEGGALKDHPASIYRIRRLYYEGQGVPRDEDRAKALWERAAELGHLFAKRNLALMRLRGRYGVAAMPSGATRLLAIWWGFFSVVLEYPYSELLQ
ncbi:MAG TPA: tetratricopeptide repeat protein [Caulobacteraceae bacterium]|nr:tetratricopeptide repeat protein [Caulobacteraceae bacterium]